MTRMVTASYGIQKMLLLKPTSKPGSWPSKDVSASDIDLIVDNGVVKLKAEPGKHPNMRKATEIVHNVSGVKSVQIR